MNNIFKSLNINSIPNPSKIDFVKYLNFQIMLCFIFMFFVSILMVWVLFFIFLLSSGHN